MKRLRKSVRRNYGLGRDFYFFGKFRSKILASRSEREHPGSFIIARKGYYYVLKDRTRGNPTEYYIIKTSTYPSQFLAKSGTKWILVRHEVKAHHFSSWDSAANTGREYFKSPHYGVKWMWQIEPRLVEHNPEWKAPLTKRKKKRLGVLYQKAFQKFSKENPRRGVLIYGRVLKVFARKTSGPYKGQDFVHTFKPGAVMIGMPDGSLRISHD